MPWPRTQCQDASLERLFFLKRRPEAKPVLLLAANPEMALRLARKAPEIAVRLMARFWPGPLTLLLPARSDISALVTGRTGTVGVRQPRQPMVCRLLAALGFPVTGTSANRASAAPLIRAEEVAREFGRGNRSHPGCGPLPRGAAFHRGGRELRAAPFGAARGGLQQRVVGINP